MVDAGEPFDQTWVDAGEWVVDVAGTQHAAIASLRPLYDPKNERIKA